MVKILGAKIKWSTNKNTASTTRKNKSYFAKQYSSPSSYIHRDESGFFISNMTYSFLKASIPHMVDFNF